MAEKRNPALIFIFITVLVDVIGFGIIIPVIPKLITDLIHGDLSDAAKIGGWLMFSYAATQFVFSPILGGLSDQYGRRKVLLFSLLGFGIDYIVVGFAPNITWLFAARIVAGITGSSISTAGAYIADVSPPEKRAQNFGLIGAAFGLGFIIGPALGGILGHYGARVPFFAAAGLTLLNWLYGFFILPESLKPENRRKFDWKKANPIGSLLMLKNYPIIFGLIPSLVLIYLANWAQQSSWTYYTMKKFDWDTRMVGYSLGFVGLTVAIVQGGLTRIIIPKLGTSKSLFVGLMFSAFGYIAFAFATQSWMMFAFMIPFAMGGLAGPALQGIISSQIPANEQGQLQGALTSLMSFTSIFGPLVMTGLFYYFTSDKAPIQFPGAPFFAGFIFMIISLLFALNALKSLKVVKE